MQIPSSTRATSSISTINPAVSRINIADVLESQCQARPGQVVIRSPNGCSRAAGESAYHSITFGELQQRIVGLRAGLQALGIQRGDRCALMVPPSAEFVELTFALFSSGAVPVFVDPGIGLKNLKACLAQAEPTAFLGITKTHIARILFGWARDSLKTLVTVGPKFGWGGVTLNSLRQPVPESTPVANTTADDVAAILFTSGSTGVPKGAVYTHGMFVAQLEKLQGAFDIQPGEIDLCTFPLFALFGPALGMTSVIPVMDATRPARVNPREIMAPVRALSVTNLFGSPALLNRVGSSIPAEIAAVRLPTLKRVLSAGAPVAPRILEQFQSLLAPGTQIFTPYGATEALPVAVIGSREVLNDTRQRTAAGAGTCVGKPVAGLEVRIIPVSDQPIPVWDETTTLPAGEIGEIVVHGPQVTQEYFRRPDLTALAKIPDPGRGRSWHRMGDVGYFDDEGRLWFCGRKSQRVITAGGVLYTDPVEGVFNQHPQVFRTALVGVPAGDVAQPVLCVERMPSSLLPAGEVLVAPAELRSQLLELGAGFEVTRTVRTILFHPRFPVDIRHNSKIFREKLAVWAAGQSH